MGTSRKLLGRLRSIEALEAGATTEGERCAAQRARQRVLDRLQRAPRIEVDIVAPDVEEPDIMPMPTADEIIARLSAWFEVPEEAPAIRAWASEIVGRVLLPDLPPDDPQSIPVEVILHLSSMTQMPWDPVEIEGLLTFLSAPAGASRAAWHRWFAGVEVRAKGGSNV